MSVVGTVVLLIGALLGWHLQRGNQALRRRLDLMESGVVEAGTGLLAESAIPLRLAPELEWARALDTPVAIVYVRPYGTAQSRHDAVAAMRSVMRGYENAFRFGERDVIVELWDSNHHGAVVGAGRLLDALAEGGCRMVDIGIAIYPQDGTDVDALVETAVQRLCPAQELLSYAVDWRGRPGPAQAPVPRVSAAA